MSKELICVQETGYADYFKKTLKNKVFLLDVKMAESAWDHAINIGTSSYFDLPNDCWLISSDSVRIGDWLEAYNDDDNYAVSKILRDSVNWPEDDFVNFFAKRKIVFKVKWKDFVLYWDDFIAIEDDCPIVIPENKKRKEAILFRPLGDVLKIR